MNKKILAIAMAIVLICGFAGAGTMAWFTSSVTSSGNEIEAGTLILGSEDENGNDVYEKFATLTFDKLQPGAPPVKVLETELKNVGSLPFYLYRMTASNIVDNNPENEKDDMILDEVLKLRILIGNEPVYYGKLSELRKQNGGFFDPITQVEPGVKKTLRIEAELPPETGNAYQGLSVKCDLNIFASQNEKRVPGSELGKRYDMGSVPHFSVEGYQDNKYVYFDWDWNPNDFLREEYLLRIKHETGATTTTIYEARILLRGDEWVVSTDGIDEGYVSLLILGDIVRIDKSAFPAEWKGFEVELSGRRSGFNSYETIPFQYFALVR